MNPNTNPASVVVSEANGDFTSVKDIGVNTNFASVVVSDANPNPMSFTYTLGSNVLKVVRIDTKIRGNNVEKNCQALNQNYHALRMDNDLQIQVNFIMLAPKSGKSVSFLKLYPYSI